MSQDIVLQTMKELGVEPTRENYLAFAYFGTPPEKLSAEEEAALPENLQRMTSDEPESDSRED
ncbi:Uncharacterised protein [uncultured archaeon]|nr:Uncharacterised protein [uncultured archaeon]